MDVQDCGVALIWRHGSERHRLILFRNLSPRVVRPGEKGISPQSIDYRDPIVGLEEGLTGKEKDYKPRFNQSKVV
jgi:hypothetical protein